MKGLRVLVTGAGGFIGSHLVEMLLARGAAVRGLLHYRADGSLGNAQFLPEALRSSVDWVHGDLLDLEFMTRAVADQDIVFHLGALIAIPHSYDAPRSFVEANAIGTLNVLEAARAAGSARVVQISTSEVYGSARYIPMDEAHPLQAQSPYAASKIAADKVAEILLCVLRVAGRNGKSFQYIRAPPVRARGNPDCDRAGDGRCRRDTTRCDRASARHDFRQ